MQRLRNDLYKAVDGPTQDLLFSRWLLGNTCTFDVEGVWVFESPTRRNSLRIWPSLVCRLDHRKRPGERFLSKHIQGQVRYHHGFLVIGCEQVSIAMYGDSEVFAIKAYSPLDSTSASSFDKFGGGFSADFPFPTMAMLWPEIRIVKYTKLFRTKKSRVGIMLHPNVSDRASNAVRTPRTECKRNGVAKDVVRTLKTPHELVGSRGKNASRTW